MTQPIFIHSLFRSASTYFFHKLRSLGPQYSCYQEPFNEALVALNDPARHERLLESPVDSPLRHPPLDRPYFFEFWLRRHSLRDLFSAEFAYRQYFVSDAFQLPAAQSAYVTALLQQAQARVVLQFCRSSGRVGQLRRQFGGHHVHLWREPRAQWWSYKVSDYFDHATQRIYRCEQLPAPLRRLAVLVGINSGSPGARYLRARANYLLFYGLWLDAWLRLHAHADLSINVDSIAVSSTENAESSRHLSELVDQPLDLSDVRTSGMVFSPEEQAFYAEAESTVNSVFMQTRRATSHSIEVACDAACRARRAHELLAHDAAAERNARQAAITVMERLAALEEARQRAWSVRLDPRRLRDYWRSLRQSPESLEVTASRTPADC